MNNPLSLENALRTLQGINIMVRNREVLTRNQRIQFYELKNATVRWLYEHGYCVDARVDVQKFPCWSCNGTGIYEYSDETCWKCSGTSIHHAVMLYAFKFKISETFYLRWHMPSNRVAWDVQLTESLQSPYVEAVRESPQMDRQQVMRALWLAWLALWLRGVEVPPLNVWPWLRRRAAWWGYERLSEITALAYEREWKSRKQWSAWKNEMWKISRIGGEG